MTDIAALETDLSARIGAATDEATLEAVRVDEIGRASCRERV